MSEQTIAQPLSGEEIVNAVLDKVKHVLQRNCDLNPVLAYESFEADIHVEIRMKDSGRQVTATLDTRVVSDEPLAEDAYLREAEAHIGEAPPNQVRLDSDQPIPTSFTDAEGKQTVKAVRYSRKEEPQL